MFLDKKKMADNPYYKGFDACDLKYAVDSVEPHNNRPMSSGKPQNSGFYLSPIEFVLPYLLYYQ